MNRPALTHLALRDSFQMLDTVEASECPYVTVRNRDRPHPADAGPGTREAHGRPRHRLDPEQVREDDRVRPLMSNDQDAPLGIRYVPDSVTGVGVDLHPVSFGQQILDSTADSLVEVPPGIPAHCSSRSRARASPKNSWTSSAVFPSIFGRRSSPSQATC